MIQEENAQRFFPKDEDEAWRRDADLGSAFAEIGMNPGEMRLHDRPGEILSEPAVGSKANADDIIGENAGLEEALTCPHKHALRAFLKYGIDRSDGRPLSKQGGR
jgi:hypothetical protein